MREPRNHNRVYPPMSAQQGALIIKRLERFETNMRSSVRADERRHKAVVRLLERIAVAIERKAAA